MLPRNQTTGYRIATLPCNIYDVTSVATAHWVGMKKLLKTVKFVISRKGIGIESQKTAVCKKINDQKTIETMVVVEQKLILKHLPSLFWLPAII